MLMTARQFDYLRHLSLRDFKSINATNPDSMPVNVKHDLDCLFMRFTKETFQNVNDEFHWCVIVVEDENAIERGLFGFGPGLGDDAGSRAAVASIAVPATGPARRPPWPAMFVT
jgi:hypothetical protein